MSTVIPVTGEAPYDVVVGHTLSDRVPDLVSGAATVAVVADRVVREPADAVAAVLESRGMRTEVVTVDGGEAAKSLETASVLWDALGKIRITRADAVVAVGGGATTDVVGFVAATWLRGVAVVHYPTTLLAMVDAAVGGKTGINTSAGKNLVGAFHPPAGVLVDLDVLATLPTPEWVNGMAEVVKAGFIADPAILELIEADPADTATPTGRHARELVERSITVKAQAVSEDLKDTGRREFLNYGHTLGHAIERVEEFRVPHGHAVSVGMVFAAALGRRCGRLDAATADRHGALLAATGLPTSFRPDAFPALLAAMQVDKKVRGTTQRFIVLDGLARPGILADPGAELLAAAYSEVAG